MIPGWSLIKVVQTIPVGCISRSRVQKIGFQNAFFKNLLDRMSETTRPRAFIFGILHHLEVLYQSCSNYAPGVKIDPALGGHNFTLIYIRKTFNDIFSLTTNGKLTKLHRNDPCVVPYQSCSNGSDWLHM